MEGNTSFAQQLSAYKIARKIIHLPDLATNQNSPTNQVSLSQMEDDLRFGQESANKSVKTNCTLLWTSEHGLDSYVHVCFTLANFHKLHPFPLICSRPVFYPLILPSRLTHTLHNSHCSIDLLFKGLGILSAPCSKPYICRVKKVLHRLGYTWGMVFGEETSLIHLIFTGSTLWEKPVLDPQHG